MPEVDPGPFGPPVEGFFAQQEPGRRGEILDAAVMVFADHGYDAGSMREIAGRVGVTEPAIYRHFPGKEALFRALIEVAARRLRAEAFALMRSVQGPTFREGLIAAFADRRRAVRFYGPVMRTILSTIGHNPDFIRLYREVLIEPLRSALIEKVAELDEWFGYVGTDRDREERVRALMALFVGYFVTSIVLEDERDAAMSDAAVRVMGWEGLRPEAG